MAIRTPAGFGLAVILAFAIPDGTVAQDGHDKPGRATSAAPMPNQTHADHAEAHETHAPAVEFELECESHEHGLFVMGEYLRLKPRRDYLDFAIVSFSQNIVLGTVESLDWQRDNGIRAGGGYRFGEGWEAGVFYTYFHANGNRLVNRPLNGTIFPTVTSPGLIEQVSEALASGSVNYNVIDAEFGRRFEVGDALNLHLFGGGRFAWIDQGFEIYANSNDANRALVSAPICFNGGGFRVGSEGRWLMTHGLSLYAKASGSLVLGQFQTSFTELNDSGGTLNKLVTNDFTKLVSVADIGLGASWAYRNLRVSGGYEFTNWFGLVDSPDFVDDVHVGKLTRRMGDLSLDGWTVRVELGF